MGWTKFSYKNILFSYILSNVIQMTFWLIEIMTKFPFDMLLYLSDDEFLNDHFLILISPWRRGGPFNFNVHFVVRKYLALYLCESELKVREFHCTSIIQIIEQWQRRKKFQTHLRWKCFYCLSKFTSLKKKAVFRRPPPL